MRRTFLIVMMLIPLWWSWSAVARICEHPACIESANQVAESCVKADTAVANVDPTNGDVPGSHLDCDGCHGMGAAYPASESHSAFRWSATSPLPSYGRFVSDPPVQGLLRPPMHLVA